MKLCMCDALVEDLAFRTRIDPEGNYYEASDKDRNVRSKQVVKYEQ